MTYIHGTQFTEKEIYLCEVTHQSDTTKDLH